MAVFVGNLAGRFKALRVVLRAGLGAICFVRPIHCLPIMHPGGSCNSAMIRRNNAAKLSHNLIKKTGRRLQTPYASTAERPAPQFSPTRFICREMSPPSFSTIVARQINAIRSASRLRAWAS